MAKKRLTPFGYEIQNGTVVIHNNEADTVRSIFHQHFMGESYNTIAKNLSLQDIKYQQEKPVWTKNIVGRILRNAKYFGDEQYPKIVDDVENSNNMMSNIFEHKVNSDIQKLKPMLRCNLCGANIKRKIKQNGIERWRCQNNPQHMATYVSDKLILSQLEYWQAKLKDDKVANLENKKLEKSNTLEFNLEILKLENEIERMLESNSIDVVKVKTKIYKLASLKYDLCVAEDYIFNNHLEQLRISAAKLDMNLLVNIVDHIFMVNEKIMRIVLKNGRILEDGD